VLQSSCKAAAKQYTSVWATSNEYVGACCETSTAWPSGQSLPLALQSPAHLVRWTGWGTARIRWGAGNACRRAVALAPFLHLQVITLIRCEEFRRCEVQACIKATRPARNPQLVHQRPDQASLAVGCVPSNSCAQERRLQSPEFALPRTWGWTCPSLSGYPLRWGPRTF